MAFDPLPVGDRIDDDLDALDSLFRDKEDGVLRYHGTYPDGVKVVIDANDPVKQLQDQLDYAGLDSSLEAVGNLLRTGTAGEDGSDFLSLVNLEVNLSGVPLLASFPLVDVYSFNPVIGFVTLRRYHLPESLRDRIVTTIAGPMTAERVYMDTLRVVEQAISMLRDAGVSEDDYTGLFPLAFTGTIRTSLSLWDLKHGKFHPCIEIPLIEAVKGVHPILGELWHGSVSPA